MRIEANVRCPLTWEEANEIKNTLMQPKYQYIDVYLGIEKFVVANRGVRTFKYPKSNIKQSIRIKNDYIIEKEI